MSITDKVMPRETKTKPVEQHAVGTQREQFKELGPLDVARDEREEVFLGMQLFEHSCNGVTFDAIAMECTGTRSPASKKCLGRFLSGVTFHASVGRISTDCHHGQEGAQQRQFCTRVEEQRSGTEAPEQIGR